MVFYVTTLARCVTVSPVKLGFQCLGIRGQYEVIKLSRSNQIQSGMILEELGRVSLIQNIQA